ncbi:MAG TPA: hypothetical protein PK156_42235 [Polyangium sp.]|nr:hypothetical protein [Polyangium sp.]
MKSALLATSIVAVVLMQTSNALADWSFFKPDPDRKGYPFLPTVNLAMAFDGSKKSDFYGNFLLGVSHYPIGDSWSPFYSVAIEMDLRSLRDSAGNTHTVPIFGPQVRGGVSFFPDEKLPISLFNAYGFIGYRAPSAFEDHTFRFGLGISSPGAGLLVLSARLILPWMVEGAFDVTEYGLRPAIRFGLSY